MREIRLLFVHYNDAERVMDFIAHVNALPLPPGWELTLGVCDNSLSWPERLRLPGNARLAVPPRNLGYLPGCVFANSRWESASPPEWLGIVNTDLAIEPEFLQRVATQSFPDTILALGPDLRLRNGQRQNPFLASRPPRRKLEFYRFLFGNPLRSRLMEALYQLRRRGRKLSPPVPIETPWVETYALHGALTLLHRRYFERGGSLQYGGFMYGEEIFFAEQFRRCGGGAAWLPQALVWHDAGATTAGKAQATRRAQWQHQSFSLLLQDFD